MRGRRMAAVVVACALTAACGARLDDEQVAAVQGQGVAAGAASGTVPAASGARPVTGGPAPAAAATGGPAPVADPAASGAPAPAPADGVDPAAAAAGAPCVPEGASDVGVTPDSISLGQVATISGPIPGLSQTAVNGVRAYVAYRNSQGGVCGRELELVTADDRLDTGQNRAEHARMLERVFGFVGGWSVVDDGGAAVLGGTNVPDVGLSVTIARASLPNNFSTNPIALDGGSGAGTILQHMVSAYQPTSAAVVWGAQATSRDRAQGYVRDLEALGLNVVVRKEVAITETNYVPVAQEIENAGAELVITTLENTGIARLAQAFAQVGYRPKVPFYGAQAYGTQFLELAGSAAEGAILGLTHPIVEEASGGGALGTFVEWYERVNPGEPIDFFSFQGWTAADMLSDAILAAGPAPTRDAVLGVLATYTAFDADGLVAPFNPAGKANSACFIVVTVEGGQWRRVHPAGGGFACP